MDLNNSPIKSPIEHAINDTREQRWSARVVFEETKELGSVIVDCFSLAFSESGFDNV